MQIYYKIKQINTKQFAFFPDKYVNGEGVAVKAEFEFKVHSSLMSIVCVSKFSFSQREDLLLTSEVWNEFAISPEGFQQLQEQRKVSVDFLQYLATISTGTSRGIIHAKTEGTVLNAIVLPPINLKEIIKNDLYI